MWIKLRNIVLAGLVVAWVTPALGEYYQYRDHNGVLRFTDDISSIPPDQRPDVKTHQSVVSEPVKPSSGTGTVVQEALPDAQAKQDVQPGETTWEDKKGRSTEELDRKQAELKKMFAELQAERSALEAKAPPDSAPFKDRASYNVAVEDLNAKIADYEAQLDAFNQKLNEYNAQFKK